MQQTWITTYTKKKFYPFKPDVSLVDIEHIAHVLSCEGRWHNFCPVPYSVAEHSMAVARQCRPEYKLYGLLHDAHEAYLRDMPRPVKYRDSMSEYRAASMVLQVVIHRAFSLQDYAPAEIKTIDSRMLLTESIAFNMPLASGDMSVEPYADLHLEVDKYWKSSQDDFIDMFYRLQELVQ